MTTIELKAAEAIAILPKYLKEIGDAIRELNETLKVLYIQNRKDDELEKLIKRAEGPIA